MASHLPDHHILSVEMLRTQEDRTVAVFTIVKDKRPVQYVLEGNALGRNLRPFVTPPTPRAEVEGSSELEAMVMVAAAAAAAPPQPPTPSNSGASAEGIALGEPPPKQPPTPGVVAMGESIMPLVFNLSEWALRDPAAN
jgi:hypothetical protein